MKLVMLVALFSIPVAMAEGEATAPKAAVKAPVDTIEVTNENAPGLFERIRDAHLRAMQKGTIVPAVHSS